MFIRRILAAFAVFAVVAVAPVRLHAQAPAVSLAKATAIKCTFSLMAVGTWGKEKPEAQIKPVSETMVFEGINADEGTAQLKSNYGGKYDIIVRYANGYLHLIQSFLDGHLYTTTILEKTTANGKLRAMHSRHEYTDAKLPGWTSSPEQYYGECEVIK